MLQLIKTILQKFIDDIDADNTNLSFEQECQILRILSNVDSGQDNEMNKTQAADYLGVSRLLYKQLLCCFCKAFCFCHCIKDLE